jgi:membrane-bound lytic murein transglycosylase F
MALSARTQSSLAAAFAAIMLFAGAIGLLSLSRQDVRPLVERIREAGVLVVATRHAPSAYYEGANGPDGFEYTLVQQFARHLGVKARFVFPNTLDELLDATERGVVHMAAAGLTITAQRERRLGFSLPYQYVTEQLIYRRGSKRPRSLQDVAPGDLHLVADSSHEETLQRLNTTEFPDLRWTEHRDIGIDRLLSALDQGKIRLTVVDSNDADLNRRVFPHVATAFELGEPRAIAWAFSRTGDDSLRRVANNFFKLLENDGQLRRLRARYFGHTGRLNFVDTRDFWRHVRDRLPGLEPHFKDAAKKTGIDWRLLAAIGYQESHWRPEAVSPTGVRGVMMLTRATAKQMGITDRNDPEQSIIGGAEYLRVVENKIPDRIKEPNRLWLTLAGYNIGFGHLEDARILTQRDGADPDLWLEVKQRLPLLSQKKYYKTVKRGKARGREPVTYVDNIRNYYDLLVWYTTTNDRETRDRLLLPDQS